MPDMKNPHILDAISNLHDVDLLLDLAIDSLDQAGIADTHLGVEIRVAKRCLNYAQSGLDDRVLDPVPPKSDS